MWLALLASVGLTIWEVREHEFSKKAQLWWILFVLLVHVPGYLMLRGFTAYQRQKDPQ